ncbi:Protease 4 [Polystyrenella longa]|uniref:Protease 4 n=1 Tax=Polystyrenella longa TaxID=2528007 RepID=A0A518CJ71_9PLAN|nr:signal peptide peptidase SppA [Polystyrenella longa]QDU79234.1 Protease 4 [Polystyrenella longa]
MLRPPLSARRAFLALTCFALFTSLIAAPEAAFAKTGKAAKAEKPPADKYAYITLKGTYPEAAAAPGLFGATQTTLAKVLKQFKTAERDRHLTGIVLKIESPQVGFGTLNELRQAILQYRESGKKIYAYLDSATMKDYLLASACDEIIMPESGVVMLLGLRMEIKFYKNMLDKLDIQPDALKVGEYKSAAESISRSEMSPAFREEMEAILDSYFGMIVKTIAESRSLTEEQVGNIIDTGISTMTEAKQQGLVDVIGYEDELLARLRSGDSRTEFDEKYGKEKVDTDFSGFGGLVKMMNLMMGVEPNKRASTTPKIAIVYASGPIMPGKSQNGLFGDVMGSETIVEAVRKAAKDDTVKAVVLRVNSPGGSALASDLMWHALEQVDKPIVVSMGDVAASGGYYISMGADYIYAEPGTITGSIGVVMGKVAVEGLMEKVGITTTVLSRGKNSGAISILKPMNESERATMQKMLDDIYLQFTTKAAEGREMPLDQLEKLARGRVYTGEQALEINLVDELGTLSQAIAKATELAGLTEKDRVEQLELPTPPSPFEQLFGDLDPETKLQSITKLLEQEAPGLYSLLKETWAINQLARQPGLTLMPFQVDIK